MLQPKKKRAKMRKTMSGLIMLTLLSSLILPGAAGARPAVPSQIEFSNVSVQAGQSVKVPVKLTQNEYPVNAYNMQIDYDKSTLEVVRITPAASGNIASSSTDGDVPDFQYQINNAEGWVRIIWVNSKDISQEDSGLIDAGQPLFEMEIKAKSNAAPGTTQLTVVQDDKEHWRFNNLEYSPPAELSGGTITITAASSGGNSSSPSTGSSGGGTVSTPVSSAPSTPVATKGVDIYVNGQKQEQSATASTSTAGNKVTTTIHVDNNKVINQVGNGLRTLLLPVTGTGTNTVVGELNAKLVKTMEGSNAEVVIQTDTGTYTLPASQIKVDQVVKQLGSTAPLEDVTIQIAIAPSNETKKAAIEAAASKIGNTTVVAAPVDFEVKAVYNGQQVDVNRFNAYVERSITLPEGVDGSKITTGVVLQADGTMLHVPTKVIKGTVNDSAVINSLTNSTYALIYHPTTFNDISSHWSRADVEDLASRLVVEGEGDQQFAPDRSITRAEFTAVLLRGLGLHSPENDVTTAFTDVKADSWYENEVQTAVSYGLISGYTDNSFRPNSEISRAEAMTIVSRAMKLVELAQADASETANLLGTYSDGNKVQPWAAESVASAIKQGLVQGDDGKLMTDADVSRAQTAAIVKRLLAKAGLI
ncbi:S-layer homology domain-containing protein [Paenibacillus silvae]|uniref:S-layer homology domain-containing protein n=1 Tax=Paenibacillus silvae TaxID=1325358 RepID=UPI002005AB67|nr:S-layer homology domain-containing protein [Paenibacillus silvae]MCK6073701.1 S-layer homology domain-containing protein [Paenibacillus silvae]MCK6148822.1 S-layer homology domain-containing protein [Paenibacillus silvae]MCK6267123.1 S-layer homology domain-containing protein [Paenibacillus silvae]